MWKPACSEKHVRFIAILCVICSSIAPVEAADKKSTKSTAETATPEEPIKAEPPTLPPERAETIRGRRLQQQIEQTDPRTLVTWLGIEPEQFLSLYRADASGKTYASVMLMHDNQQHPDWPGLLHQLRIQLAKQGWNTLSIAVPDMAASEVLPAIKPAISPSEPNAVAETAPSEVDIAPDKAPSIESVEYPMQVIPEKISQRIQEAMQFLRSQSTVPVFIAAIGSSATLLQRESRIMASQTISGVVLIDAASIPTMGDRDISQSQIEFLTLPVLDLVPQFNQRSDPSIRKSEAIQRQRGNYQQRTIPGASQGFEQYENAVIKAIRGWGKNLLRGKPIQNF